MTGTWIARLFRVTRVVAYGLMLLSAIVAVAAAALQTRWGKDQLRRLVVRQANLRLTARLEIGELDGSLVSGLRLARVRLSLDGQPIVAIDEVGLEYDLVELLRGHFVLGSVKVIRPRIVAARQADGRWNLAAMVRRADRPAEPRSRPIRLAAVEIVDGAIDLDGPLRSGVGQLPTRYARLNAVFAFESLRDSWVLDISRASWAASMPDLEVARLSGRIESGGDGWRLTRLDVQTSSTTLVANGSVRRQPLPTTLDLAVRAARFSFVEWAGLVDVLRNMAVDASFDARLRGPLKALEVGIQLSSTGGGVAGSVVLDTTSSPWRSVGGLDLSHLNLARWLDRADRPSDITGRVDFDLQFGRGVPVGSFAFNGPHVSFMQYEGEAIRAIGQVTGREVLVSGASSIAYGARVGLRNSSIGLSRPYPFRFRGAADGVDLRRVPRAVPVPHVDSLLSFAYDVSGQFESAFIRGTATFNRSEFLDATISPGTVGAIDTSMTPVRYNGNGYVTGLGTSRLARELDIAWLRDPRYDASIEGRFHVQGIAGDAEHLALDAGGRLVRAEVFGGALTDADVSVGIDRGSLRAAYEGGVSMVNPALALDDPRWSASLSGSARVSVVVTDLMRRTPALEDVFATGSVSLVDSTIGELAIARGAAFATLSEGTLTVDASTVEAAQGRASGAGTIGLGSGRSSSFEYDVERADLTLAEGWLGRSLEGEVVTRGRVSGPASAPTIVGDATVQRLDTAGVRAATTAARYEIAFPTGEPARPDVRVTFRSSGLEVFEQSLEQAGGTVVYGRDGRVDIALDVASARPNVSAALAGSALVHPERRSLDLLTLAVTLRGTAWRLAPSAAPPTVAWHEQGFDVSALALTAQEAGDQRISVAGAWRQDGSGALQVTLSRVNLDRLVADSSGPAVYAGILDLDATVRGGRERPLVTGRVRISDGRLRRIAFERVEGRVDYAGGVFEVNLQLDQTPGVWLHAAGTVPLAMFSEARADLPINLSVASSSISLSLIEGLTDQVRELTGRASLSAAVVGTGRDPHFTGTIEITDAGFVVAASGARYKNGRSSIRLVPDRVSVEALYLEDSSGRPLNASGSLGTHEMKVGDLEIDVDARGFEVLRNAYGTAAVDAQLTFRGQAESPRIGGSITIASGVLDVNTILERTLLQPVAAEVASGTDQTRAPWANPWERLGLGVELRVPNSLRMQGDNLQVTPGTPLGIGDFNVRVLGDLYLYKDPDQPLYLTGSLDSVTGSYAFQGRRFAIDPASSIIFRGDLNPELYVTVQREISGVQARVNVIGPIREPELQLTSTPPLEQSDILSLIVFGTSTNQLSSAQQQELAVRAGTLAAGFLSSSLLTALQRSTGLDTLEIGQGDVSSSARVTIGGEVAPGLVARFSRQFGADEYDEATVEYALSRILRLRGTFSDAGSLTSRSPFRRVERAGLDVLLFFSF